MSEQENKKHDYYIILARPWGKQKIQKYTSLGRACQGIRYRYPYGKIYGVNIINGKPTITARYIPAFCEVELDEQAKEIRL